MIQKKEFGTAYVFLQFEAKFFKISCKVCHVRGIRHYLMATKIDYLQEALLHFRAIVLVVKVPFPWIAFETNQCDIVFLLSLDCFCFDLRQNCIFVNLGDPGP